MRIDTRAAIDMDIVVNRVANACQTVHYTTPQGLVFPNILSAKAANIDPATLTKHIHTFGLGLAKSIFRSTLKRIEDDLRKRCKCKEFLYVLTAPGGAEHNFRYFLTDKVKYKGQRKEKAKLFQAMFEYAQEYLPADRLKLITGSEADDYLVELHDPRTVLASCDKDMFQSPGMHYYIRDNSIKLVTQEEASRNLCYQLVIGDAVDNVPSITRWLEISGLNDEAKKVSKSAYKKKAETLLGLMTTSSSMLSYVRALFLFHGLDPKETLDITGQMVYLWRYEGDGWFEYLFREVGTVWKEFEERLNNELELQKQQGE
jgi:hypothetical protein